MSRQETSLAEDLRRCFGKSPDDKTVRNIKNFLVYAEFKVAGKKETVTGKGLGPMCLLREIIRHVKFQKGYISSLRLFGIGPDDQEIEIQIPLSKLLILVLERRRLCQSMLYLLSLVCLFRMRRR